MTDKEKLESELEKWQLKAVILQTQQVLFKYQAQEVQDNLTRIQKALEEV